MKHWSIYVIWLIIRHIWSILFCSVDSNPVIDILEAIYMTWFTIEFVVRFLSCPDHCKFIKSFMNIIDLLAILPYYLAPLVDQLDSIKQVGQVLRILRIMRVFKMARHSRGLQGNLSSCVLYKIFMTDQYKSLPFERKFFAPLKVP